ncbi:MAG: phage portal protein, partial [Rickettsiaceae bacterium]|nr:phage portal protein [Rickettsiaceae bacterium]
MIKKYLSNFFSTNKKSVNNFYQYQDIDSWSKGSFDFDNIGYQNNVIVYKCVNLIANAASHVPWNLQSEGLDESSIKYLTRLLQRPNPGKGGAEFFINLISNKLLFGSSYILALASVGIGVKEIHVLKNDLVNPILENYILKGYEYNGKKRYYIDSETQQSQILHLRTYNPKDNIQGFSPLNAAKLSIALHNKSSEWNHALLKNGARPSGALVVKNGSYLNDDQFHRLKEQLAEKYSGASYAGKPMLLEGGLEWQEMHISPKDMDFIESRNCAAREIALAFGVPPQLLGIAGDSTYSNMHEARLALWEETIIPLLNYIADALGNWFSYWYQCQITLDFNRDAISTLTERRENLWAKISN